jgi:glycosyltransferase EpsE
MSNTKSFVSVIMSSYNSINTIEEAIESIINQTYKNLELLIMDDCSEDGSFEKIDYYKNKFENIRVFRNKKNLGLTKSLNLLIENSSGEYIARQDADDLSFKKRIEEQVKEMNKHDLDFCTTRALVKNTRKKIPGVSYFVPSKIISKFKNPFIHGTLMVKTNSIIKVGSYNENFY